MSLSGGKDSTAMLLRLIDENRIVDDVVFYDTTVEFPEMYEHLDKLDDYLIDKGYPRISRVKSEKNYEYYLLKHIKRNQQGNTNTGYSFPDSHNRWCTTLKNQTISAYIKSKYSCFEVIEYVGIAFDEPNRIKEKYYPLVEWEMTESDCLKYCYDKGFNFGGLYDKFDRVSCWCCPLSRLSELKNVKDYYPYLWQKLLEWQENTWRKFRADYSVKDLDVMFSLMDEYNSKGLNYSTRSKIFRTEFKNRLKSR